MSKRLDSVILQELRYAAERILWRLQPHTLEEFLTSEDLQDIVLRQLTIVGEASARVSDHTKKLHPQVEWRQITGMRNFVVHEYFRVDYATIWDAVFTRLPLLLAELPAVIAQAQAEEAARSV